jgi:hypothetical protein
LNLAEFAAAARDLAARAEASLAHDCAEAGANVFLPILRSTTPVLSGHLRDSERLDLLSGGGPVAVAVVSPHTVYAEFRETGGTIRVKRAKVLTDGSRFFGKQVTQAGSHYVERAHEAARGPVEVAMQMVADRFFSESGL